MDYGYRRVAAAAFDTAIGGIEKNTKSILEAVELAASKEVDLLCLPELCITGYSCGDMFLRADVASAAMDALLRIEEYMRESEKKLPVTVIGLPVRLEGRLFNCAAIIVGGEIRAIVPKTYLPNYNEFYEKRWFTSAFDTSAQVIRIDGRDIPFGSNIIVEAAGMKIGCEICEDLWVTTPPSDKLAAYGANIIVNPSASNEIVAKKSYRQRLVAMQSASCNCAYVYSSAGSGESTCDVVYSGHQIIAECGGIKAQDYSYFLEDIMMTVAEIDVEKIENDQIRLNSFKPLGKNEVRTVYTDLVCERAVLPEHVNAYPFVPSDDRMRKERCEEILSLQAAGLATRMRKTGMKKAVIGISGGLDSTLALLVVKEAFDMLKLPMSNIIGITMPGFGTTKLTKSSADTLMELVGCDSRCIDITTACRQHMKDIGHDENIYDVTYENVQARERTQILMDLANKEGGLVIGTGDLSEMALGWCTYNGDHMSMYAVNVSIPKTLVKFIIETYACEKASEEMKQVLIAVCNTIISPELLPPDKDGNIGQSTEQTIGKYDLHDFFLYNFIRNGFGREKIYALAQIAFPAVEKKQIEDTLSIFMRRFKLSQFKRNCVPDGPKVGSVALSPRGDWRFPSDYDSL